MGEDAQLASYIFGAVVQMLKLMRVQNEVKKKTLV